MARRAAIRPGPSPCRTQSSESNEHVQEAPLQRSLTVLGGAAGPNGFASGAIFFRQVVRTPMALGGAGREARSVPQAGRAGAPGWPHHAATGEASVAALGAWLAGPEALLGVVLVTSVPHPRPCRPRDARCSGGRDGPAHPPPAAALDQLRRAPQMRSGWGSPPGGRRLQLSAVPWRCSCRH